MVASIPRIYFAFSFFINANFFSRFPNYLNCATFSKDLLAVSKLWFRSTFWWRHTTIHLVFSVFTYRPTSLLASKRATVLFLMVFTRVYPKVSGLSR
jgi:hypothetical protein